MKIRTIKEITNTERQVAFTGGQSFRLLLASDNMGFSFHKTVVNKGRWHWHYKNHLESCYCISGKGKIHNLETGQSFDIIPETIYVLDNHDNHEFEAFEETVLLSVFNPPIVGNESHDENGNYKLIETK
jgi:L-ectoine synthase